MVLHLLSRSAIITLPWLPSPAFPPSHCHPHSASPLILSRGNSRAKDTRRCRPREFSLIRLALAYRQGRAALARAFPHPHLPSHTRSHPLRKAIVLGCVLLSAPEFLHHLVNNNPTEDMDNMGANLGLNHGSCIMRKSLSQYGLNYCGIQCCLLFLWRLPAVRTKPSIFFFFQVLHLVVITSQQRTLLSVFRFLLFVFFSTGNRSSHIRPSFSAMIDCGPTSGP